MGRLRSSFLLLTLSLLSASRLLAQQGEQVQLTAYETVYNGQISIYERCEVENGWGTSYYPSVLAWNCKLTDPNGSVPYTGNANWNAASSWIWNYYYPVSTFGNWTASFQSWISLYEDPYFADNGFYDDFDGYAYFGVQQCGSSCTLEGYGELASLYKQTEQFGNSSVSVYVSPVTVEVNPSSYSLDAGEQETFTASVGGIPAGGNTGVTWTLDGASVGTGSTYTYTAPGTNFSQSSHVLKACSLAAPAVCDPVTILVLAEGISIETPSPSVILADGSSVSYLYADLTNTPAGTAVTWTPTCPPSPGTVCSTGDATATYTAPTAASVFTGQNAASPALPVPIKGCIGTNASVCDTKNLTLVEPVSITSTAPATLTAGTTVQATINGAGFGPQGATPTVSFSNPGWGSITINQPCTAQSNAAVLCPSITIPANLSNMTGSQPVTVTVSTTTAGIATQATYNVNVTPIAYTYSITLSPTATQLTYGGTSNIVPIIACKANGAACGPGVSNPQEANFSIINGVGSLSNINDASSTTFTAIAMNPTQQTVTVQGCAWVQPTSCATTSLSVAATTLTLNPATLPNPLTGGQYQAFSASIQNPGADNQLAWTLTPSPSGAAAGIMNASISAITGTPSAGASANTYSAPVSISTLTTVTLKACMTANTSICASPVAITLNPPPTFTVATSGPPMPLSLGHTVSFPVTVSALYGFSGQVTLSVNGLPAGVTAQISPATVGSSGSATVTLTSAYSAATFLGNSTVTVTGTSGSIASPGNFSLTTRPLQYPCTI